MGRQIGRYAKFFTLPLFVPFLFSPFCSGRISAERARKNDLTGAARRALKESEPDLSWIVPGAVIEVAAEV